MPENKRAEYLKRIKEEWNKASVWHKDSSEGRIRTRDAILLEIAYQLSTISDNLVRLK